MDRVNVQYLYYLNLKQILTINITKK